MTNIRYPKLLVSSHKCSLSVEEKGILNPEIKSSNLRLNIKKLICLNVKSPNSNNSFLSFSKSKFKSTDYKLNECFLVSEIGI